MITLLILFLLHLSSLKIVEISFWRKNLLKIVAKKMVYELAVSNNLKIP